VAEKYLFVTGKLAAPALRATLARLSLPFEYEVAVLRISVAALMTPAWIARFLEPPEGTTHVLLPGLCDGDPGLLADRFGVLAEKGPADLKQLPRYFGLAEARAAYGGFDIRIFAEINNVPYLSREQVLNAAAYYRDSGADVIDLGLSPDRTWLDDGPAIIGELKAQGYCLSIDTLRPDEIRMADAAGVDYVLSLNGTNRDLAADLRATPILIPDDLASLDATVAELERLGKPYLLDPILTPINFGFAASLSRYVETRRKYPNAEMLMGIGNITELTEADTTGMTALLIGFCQELGIRHVLTTEVINWAQGVVRETDIARRLMHFAQEHGGLPKHLDSRLLTVRESELIPYGEDELRAMQAEITDPNYRIFVSDGSIYVFNAERFIKGDDILDIFEQLGVDEATHAFYLGMELMKAHLARNLGKNYRQESPLDWGYRTFADARREHVTLTATRKA
jgi:dihydropteroate synthase-like protein